MKPQFNKLHKPHDRLDDFIGLASRKIEDVIFILFMVFLIVGMPWLYYILTGNIMEF